MQNFHRFTRLVVLIGGTVLLGACTTDPSAPVNPSAGRAPVQLDLDQAETGYYGGQVYVWSFPSGSSNNQNQVVVDCFHLGVDVTSRPTNHVARLYAVFLPGAHQRSCPDGTELHDHILSAVPGTPDYSTVWDLMEAWPGPNFDPASCRSRRKPLYWPPPRRGRWCCSTINSRFTQW